MPSAWSPVHPASPASAALGVRPYAAADLDRLIALFGNSVRTIARRDYTLDQVLAWAPEEIDREGWAMRLAASDTWVATHGDCVAGFTSLEPNGHIDLLYVHPDFQSRGVASMLLRRLDGSAEARGMVRLFTEASITARHFFERRGFQTIEMQTVRRRGQELINYRMERWLAPRRSCDSGRSH
jgi:putative acetyltransferase